MRGRHTRAHARDPAGPTATVVVIGLLGGLAGWATVGGWWGLGVGLLVGAACGRWLARRPAPGQRARTDRVASDLPFALDLVAAALRAGAPPQAAARFVAEAVGGPVGERLHRVARALRLGAGAAEAWAVIGDGDEGARVARAAQRSGDSGAALAGALGRVADDLRADAVLAAEARARKAGVLIVLPLGLCFLPAFVLTGLVPVIVAVVGTVLTTADQP